MVNFFLNTMVLVILSMSLSVFSQKQPKVGLVLSGGGAKGFAHIGVIKELEKANIQIDYIGGTSMGAMIGALYAAGYTADEIEKKVKAINFDDMIKDAVPRSDIPLFYKQYLSNKALFLPISKGKISLPQGVSEGQNAQNYFTELFSVIDNTFSFKDLPIPFFCVATDIENGERVVLENGDLAKSVRASGAFPTLVKPIEIRGKLLVDGGVVDNFPVKELRKKGVDIIIGVDVQEGLHDRNNLNSAFDVLTQIASFSAHEESENQKTDVDLYLKPNIKGFNVISFDKADIIINNGVTEAQKFRSAFDSISKLQVKRRVVTKHKYDEYKKFLIDQIELNGNEQYSYDYVVGTLGISLCDSVSYHEVSNKINRLTGTKNFTNIKYELHPVGSSKRLEITLKETDDRVLLGLGVHYDQIFGLGVLTNYTHKRLFTQNDIFSVDIGFGDKIRYDLNYFVDNGYSLGVGFSSSLKSFNLNIKDLGLNVFRINKINVSFLEIINRFYVQTKFKKKYALNLGVDFRRLKATSETILFHEKPTMYDNSNYALAFGKIKIDNFDNNIYPTKGFYVDAQMDWVFYSNRDKINESLVNKIAFKPFTQIKGVFSTVNSLGRFSFQQTYETGLTLLNKPGDAFSYKIGGYNKNMINNFVSFYGWDTLDFVKNNFLKGLASLRYNCQGNHNILLDMNLIKMGKNNFLRDKLIENIYSGYSFGYGYKSLIGPVELRAIWAPGTKIEDIGVLFNVGFWF